MEKLTGSVNPGRIDLRTVSAVAVCRITRGLLRMLRRGGTSLPGRAAMAVQPSLLGTVSSGVETVLVTGTNGKTTTVGMLEQGLSEMGMDVLSNRSGANLLSGITAEYAAAADWRGRPTKLCAVVECDEGSLHLAVPLLHPRVIVVTNLFRDQLDRYGEVMHTLETIREGILKAPEAVLCLNADDSLTASLALDVPNPVLWYGLNTGPEETEADAGRSGREETEESGILPGREGVEKVLGQSDREEREEDGIQSGREETEDLDASCCIRCGTKYKYRYRTYAHLGSFYCPVCGYARREPDTAVTSIDRLSAFGTEIRLRVPGRPEEDIPLRIGVPALFNVYNAAAAVCAFFALKKQRCMESDSLPCGHLARCFIHTPARAADDVCDSTHRGDSIEAPCPVFIESDLQKMMSGIGHFSGRFGRMELFELNGVRIQMILVKNPAGCDQAIEYLRSLGEPYSAVLCLNDADADGHDISWIWDAGYERLCEDPALRGIYVWGRRAEDLRVRLKYAGARESSICLVKKTEILLKKMRRSRTPVFILPNYTAMLLLRDALRRAAGKKAFWEE